MKAFDYIIAGGGAAGLSLAWNLSRSEILRNKTVLIIDRDDKKRNDRTWGFWTKDFVDFDDILFRQFHRLEFVAQGFHRIFEMKPYSYKVIRGIDFYGHVISHLGKFSNISFLKADIELLDVQGDRAFVITSAGTYSAGYVFSSLFHEPEILIKARESIYLRQHFKGWIIKANQEVFNPEVITMFDFRTPQLGQMRFMYLVPHASRLGLVEFTLFTENLLQPDEYDAGIRDYIQNVLKISDYQVEETEFGIIPMTNFIFPSHFKERVVYIGSAGGSSKPSSGYTFTRIQKHIHKIIQALEKGKNPVIPAVSPPRYLFYDSVLLHILKHQGQYAEHIFTQLFKNNALPSIFQFLDEEGGLLNDLKITTSLPKGIFLRATAEHLKMNFNL